MDRSMNSLREEENDVNITTPYLGTLFRFPLCQTLVFVYLLSLPIILAQYLAKEAVINRRK